MPIDVMSSATSASHFRSIGLSYGLFALMYLLMVVMLLAVDHPRSLHDLEVWWPLAGRVVTPLALLALVHAALGFTTLRFDRQRPVVQKLAIGVAFLLMAMAIVHAVSLGRAWRSGAASWPVEPSMAMLTAGLGVLAYAVLFGLLLQSFRHLGRQRE